MIRRLLLCLLPLTVPAAALADLAEDTVVEMAQALARVKGIDSLLAACPADIHATRSNWLTDLVYDGSDFTLELCRDNPSVCLDLCAVAEDAEGCFSLALMLEIDGADTPLAERAGRGAHALSCTLGKAAACTNRGGGIRNDPLPGDPWELRPQGEIDACLFATFTLTCAQGDSWGCAMLGQALALGEGTQPDPAAARIAYDRACTLASTPDFAACTFARNGLDMLPD